MLPSTRPARPIPRRRFSGVEARTLKGAGYLSQRRLKGLGFLGSAAPQVPASWQVDPKALLALAAQAKGKPLGRLGRLAYFRGFGLSPTTTSVAESVAPKAASAAASALVAGAAAGPIGIAAGAVVALALTLFQKNYFNVADANAACAQEEALWQKYLTVQGHVAGRALGWPTMQTLMHAATGAGLFPLNSTHLSFHEGTLQCAGNGAWVDSFLSNGLGGTSCSQNNCMINALQKFKTVTVPSGTPDAVYFIDSIVLPMNAGDQIPWINSGASNPVVHQMLYDLADAYLAQNNVASTPYVKYPAATTPAASTTTASSTSSTSAVAQQPFPGFDTSLSETDPRLSQPWTETENGYTTTWTPAGEVGFFSTEYPNVTTQIEVEISGNSILGLRQDSDGGWAKYTGTFDSTGLNVSGTRAYYPKTGAQGASSNWSAVIHAPPTASSTPAVSTPVASTTPVASMPEATMAETGTTAAAAPVNVTVTAPAAAAPAATPTWVWVALAGAGALGFLMLNKKGHR